MLFMNKMDEYYCSVSSVASQLDGNAITPLSPCLEEVYMPYRAIIEVMQCKNGHDKGAN